MSSCTLRRIYALATATLLSVPPTAESFAPHNQPIPQQALSDPTILQIKALHDAPQPLHATPVKIIAPSKARTPKMVGTTSRANEPKTTITASPKSTSLLPDNANGSNQQSRKKMQRPTLDSALKQKAARRSDKNHGSWPQYEPHTLLTAAQEREYAFRIRTFRAAVKLRDSLVSFQDGVYIHPTEAQWAAACGTSVADLHRLVEEGQDARAVLVSSNIGLVVNQAKRHFASLKSATEADGGVGTILTMSDMIQEGNLGLMEAAERFEPEKGLCDVLGPTAYSS
jgi:DNA-directed RNA polymerase sigma subunit (sigma70/sigma32)